MRSDDASQLDELQRALLKFLLEKQARLFDAGFAAHAHVTVEDCATKLSVSAERVRSALFGVSVVFRDEPLAAARLLSAGYRLSRGTVSDERIKTLILAELWADARLPDSALDTALRQFHKVELSFSDLRRFRGALNLLADGANDVSDALRSFAPCTWLREPFQAWLASRTNRPARGPQRTVRTVRGPVAVGVDRVPPPGYRYIERPLFPHQQEALEALNRWHSGPSDRGILCLPTGGGKTKTAVTFLLKTALAAGQRCLWLSHRDELIEQAYATFVESSHLSPRAFVIGKWTSGEKHVGVTDVTVASIPTLAFQDDRGLAAFTSAQGGFDVCVVDECHHGAARTWRRLIEALRERAPGLRVLGLSATPTRTDEKELTSLTRHFGEILFEVATLPLIERGILANPRIIAVDTGRRFAATAAERDSFEQFHDLPSGLVTRIADDTVRNEVIARAYLTNRADWGQTLIFAATTEQSRRLGLLLRGAGVRVDEVYGQSTASTRVRIVEAFRRRELDVVVNCGVFAEGTDLPSVRTVVLARPTRSRILFAQMVGRGMRGPALGGTTECNVVSFFDEVLGLMHAHLATGFSSELEANEALGLAPTEETEPAEGDVGSTDVGSGEAAAIRSLFQAHDLGPVDGCDLPLLGWFEARSGPHVRYLPCFEVEERLAVDVWIASRPGGGSPSLANVPASAVTEFVQFATDPSVVIHWRGLELVVGADEVEEVAAGLVGIRAVEPVALASEPVLEQVEPVELPSEPEWWVYAKECVEAPAGTVPLKGELRVRPTSLAAAETLWNRFGGMVPVEDVPFVIGLVRTASLRQGGDPDEAEAIISNAISSGIFPLQRARPAPPDHAQLVVFLDSKPRSDWLNVIDILKATAMFVHAIESRRGLLLELLGYTTARVI